MAVKGLMNTSLCSSWSAAGHIETVDKCSQSQMYVLYLIVTSLQSWPKPPFEQAQSQIWEKVEDALKIKNKQLKCCNTSLTN